MFPFCVHLMSWEKEHVSSEALNAARIACNECMTKFARRDAFNLRFPCLAHVLELIDSRLVIEEHLVNPWVAVPELALVSPIVCSL
ncbi:hypothetical protein MKX03_012421 [Papaver bracteatum]|nr:hypothetical protein MKX03_012421 [Papaver bracteatum]